MSSATKKAGRKSESRRSKRGAESHSLQSRVERALTELTHIGRIIARRQGADGKLDNQSVSVSLELPLKKGAQSDPAQRLIASMRSQLATALSSELAFLAGQIYCFQCLAADCAHATPSEARETFSGYSPTGRPCWLSFTNLCIERKDPRVDTLFSEAPEIIAISQSNQELQAGLLPDFGQGSVIFNLLGQVVVGLVPRSLKLRHTHSERVALTFQIVESQSSKQSKRLRLNLIGMTQDEIVEAASEHGARSVAEGLRRTIQQVRHQLAAASSGPQINSPEIEPFLSQLKGDLERVFRPARRRTQHAQQRHLGGQRPTSLAMTDALNVPQERLLRDIERHTVIVLGKKNRAHVFSFQGRHVTSLQLKPGEVDRKSKRKRWRMLTRDEALDFKRILESD